MGDIGGMLGLAGGAGGSGFAAPTAAPITNPTNADQLNTAYGGVQNSMQSQQALLQALQAQNGLGNQSQVYGQLQGVANGTGPNPAQAMLNQSTGQNVANQAALMAGQRGAGANIGLMARQAAQQGAGIQQNAAGQAATLQANQSLNAINSAGSMANTQAANQVGQTNANATSQQAEQAALMQAQGAYNTAQVGMQSNVNQGNTGLAQTNMGAMQNMIGGAGNALPALLAAQGGVIHKYADGGMTSPADQSSLQASVNAAMTPATAPAAAPPVQSKFGRFLKGFSAGAEGQSSGAPSYGQGIPAGGAMQQGMTNLVSGIGGAIKNSGNNNDPGLGDMAGGPGDAMPPASGDMTIPMMNNEEAVAAKGGLVPALLSPGEKYLKPDEAKAVAKGKKDPASSGKMVPGKPKFKGNNYANDVVPAKLEEGGVVIPNSIMQSKDPARGAAEFVRTALAKKKAKV
jgi:hypothetical protein